uniref:Low density lipoprotein receptor adaptor protein 1 n=1 Tax=Ficedula albicollis TaxID=59894 RepID=A0A803WFM4_FICAL
MLFTLKYLGMTLVEQPKGEELSAAAVKRIVATAKASGKKLQKVTLMVSPRGIVLRDSSTNELIENISIYRISYCTADKSHDKVFAYIAQNQLNESLECHAFLCSKRKMAQAVTLTVAQAFRIAFEFWQAAKEGEIPPLCTGTLRGSLIFFPFFFPASNSQLSFATPVSPARFWLSCSLWGFLLSAQVSPSLLPKSWQALMGSLFFWGVFSFCREGEEGKIHPGSRRDEQPWLRQSCSPCPRKWMMVSTRRFQGWPSPGQTPRCWTRG